MGASSMTGPAAYVGDGAQAQYDGWGRTAMMGGMWPLGGVYPPYASVAKLVPGPGITEGRSRVRCEGPHPL